MAASHFLGRACLWLECEGTCAASYEPDDSSVRSCSPSSPDCCSQGVSGPPSRRMKVLALLELADVDDDDSLLAGCVLADDPAGFGGRIRGAEAG
mgnify:CR=1 FL=1